MALLAPCPVGPLIQRPREQRHIRALVGPGQIPGVALRNGDEFCSRLGAGSLPGLLDVKSHRIKEMDLMALR